MNNQNGLGMNAIAGIARAVLAGIGGTLCASGKTDEQSWAQVSGAIIILLMAAWSVYSKKTITLPPADKSVPLLVLVAMLGFAGCKSVPVIPVIPVDPIRDVITNIVPDIVTPGPQTNAPALPFDPDLCSFHRIAGDVLSWPETRTLTVNKFTRDKLWSTCSGNDWPARDGLQGCFGLAVEQQNGEIIVGPWDWNRSKHQPMKELKNLNPLTKEGKPSEHAFFKLYPGARIWWFTTAFSRDARRTVKERTQFVEGRWP
ncbi:MAG: hypothetical protein WC657_09600 [Candidatus Paceibacterota bacterium]|jgi:hypothetical protein